MDKSEATTSPLRSGQGEAATSLLGSGHVERSTHSPLRNGQCVYDVWLMTGLESNRRIASKETLREAHDVITPEMKREYVYILKWTPVRKAAPIATTTPHPQGPFGALQGQHRAPEPTPTCEFIWGCLCNREHTNDLRDQVRAVLRS